MVKNGLKNSSLNVDSGSKKGPIGDNFDKRLDNLKDKLGSGADRDAISESFGIKIVADVISGLIVGGVLGYITDKFLGTSPIFLILLMVFGFFMGFYIFYKDMDRRRGLGNKNKENKLGK